MNFSSNALTVHPFGGSQSSMGLYDISSTNVSVLDSSSLTSAKTTEMIANYFFTNFTRGEISEVRVERLTSRRPTGKVNGPQEILDDSPSQLVNKHTSDKISFIFAMILIPCFSVFGSVGNLLSLRVLVHHRMRTPTNMVLAALSMSDLLFLLHALYFSSLRLYALRNPLAGEQLRSVTYPVLGPYGSVVTARITTGLTMMLSLERLVAVYFPMKAKVMCGKVMTMTCIVIIYLLTALAFIPNALKYHSYHVTINNHTTTIMRRTELGKNDLFYLVYGNILNILFRFIPLLILMLVNILIALAIRRTWSLRRTMSNGGSASYEQNRITMMLLMVSLVFLICIMPGAIHSIMEQAYKQYASYGHQSNMYNVIRNITYFLETVNSSVNFIIYMAFSTKFCLTYKQIFCCSERGPVSRISARTVIRVSFRPQNGSKTSMTSYRELYLLNQLGKGKVPDINDNSKPAFKNGLVGNASSVVDDVGKITFRSKYSVGESFSSNSQRGHSNQSKGENWKESSVHSVHSNHSSEPSAVEMYS